MRGPAWLRAIHYAEPRVTRVEWEEWAAIIIAAVLAGLVLWVEVVR